LYLKIKGYFMKISNDVANVLANSRVEENKLFLPDGQLDRKLYMAVNKVLTTIKGKWNRGSKVHIFPECPSETIDSILLTGEYTDEKKEFQFFETPHELASKLVEMADIKNGDRVLEPSAGRGRIAELIAGCHCVELNQANRAFLREHGFDIVGENFMDHNEEYDVVVANPPFTRQQDVDHVNKMMDLAARRVVSVMSASVMFRNNKKTVDFRNRVNSLGGTIEILPGKTFAESGTNVNTCVVCVDV
jgi:predicted RNA methylase